MNTSRENSQQLKTERITAEHLGLSPGEQEALPHSPSCQSIDSSQEQNFVLRVTASRSRAPRARRAGWLQPCSQNKVNLRCFPGSPASGRLRVAGWPASLQRPILVPPLGTQGEGKTLRSRSRRLRKADLWHYPWHKQRPDQYSRETTATKPRLQCYGDPAKF